jgi:hypothetical protein
MNWDQLQAVSRYATPEVFTVAGVLLGGLAAWKAVGWAVRAVGALLGRFSFAPLMMSLLFVGGAATTGWGMARWGEWSYAPAPTRTDLSEFDAQVFAILKHPANYEYQMKATTEFAKLREARSLDRESPLELMSMGPLPPPPDLAPGATATLAGIATCVVAIFWAARKFC